MPKDSKRPTAALWARFRFSVVGPLLSSPPPRGELRSAIRALAEKTWTHPVSGRDARFAAVTVERWYYKAFRERDDPVGVLRRAVRKDSGKVSLPSALAVRLRAQYRAHKHWSYQLHYDNLAATARKDRVLGELPSYSTVRRFMRSCGLVRKPRAHPRRPGEIRAAHRRETREVRSYEAEYVGALWHLDFHHGSLKVLTSGGKWERPIALGLLDDHSRLCCHLQWYLSESADDLVHGLSQAIQKRGLPRALLTDNGAAMVAEEVKAGLLSLGIVHEKTLPYSPYQNGKQESFWGRLEGRLVEMLETVRDLSLEFLNEATQAWVELEYNRALHRETGQSPRERYGSAPDVLRPSPSSKTLREAFRLETHRRQRTSDGTISLEGMRFEIPVRYRALIDLSVRYARWDLGCVHLVDERTGGLLAPIYPLDRAKNSDGRRRLVGDETKDAEKNHDTASGDERQPTELPPLLERLLVDYSADGLPPSYLPKTPGPKKDPKREPKKGEDV